MKQLNKKQIIFGSIALACLLFLIYMLIFPLGYLSNRYYVYSSDSHQVESVGFGSKFDRRALNTPFTVMSKVNIPQVIVFTIIFIALITCIIFFFKSTSLRPTKAARLQAQIDELQKQVDELKKGD